MTNDLCMSVHVSALLLLKQACIQDCIQAAQSCALGNQRLRLAHISHARTSLATQALSREFLAARVLMSVHEALEYAIVHHIISIFAYYLILYIYISV